MNKPIFIPKVLLLGPYSAPTGGVKIWMQNLVSECTTLGLAEIQVLDWWPKKRILLNYSRRHRSIKGILALPKPLVRLTGKLFTFRPTVVHIASSGGMGVARDIFVILICKAFSVPSIYHLHFGRIPKIIEAGSLEAKLILLAAKMSWHTIVLDEMSESALLKCGLKKNLKKIPNFIQESVIESSPTSNSTLGNYVLYSGHLIPQKGIRELAQAWEATDKQEWNLILLGAVQPDFKKEFEQMLIKQEQILHLDELDHHKALYLIANAQIVVLPSHTEGFPLVILEAMALGRAIIGTKVGAMEEMLREGCGILVNQGDSIEIALSLKTLMENQVLRSSIGDRARKRVLEKFTSKIVIRQYLALWVGARRTS